LALTPGACHGIYEVITQIGAGGMGEVYKATDTILKRSVALKVMPASVAADPERLARFQREAEVLAALNHPNIAAIYGLERSGDTTALVMELVDGDDLSQQIEGLRAKGLTLPLDEALPIAKQMAEAIEAAHEQGIVHRDLKPANIKVRADGTVKVLDFGLAKAMGPTGAMAAMSPSVSLSPTITSPAMTQAGMILGTAAYMSPEQARGRAVDKRADIWAFGAILFEMLAGSRAFAGDDLSMTLAAVVMQEPEWAALPAATPPHVQQLLHRCLVKDPHQRIRDMGDVRLALDGTNDAAPAAPRQIHRSLTWVPAAIAAAALAIAAGALFNRPAPVQSRSARLTIPLPPGDELTSYPAITRDGRTVAYVAQHGNDDAQLYVRDLNAFDARMVPGSGGARQPFFSPDGKWVAFFAQGQLQKAEVTGGAPIRLAEARYPFGGTWNDDDTIIYVASLGSGLLRIPVSGGTPETLTKPDSATQGYAHVFPQALPAARSALFAVWGQTQGGAVLSLDSRKWDVVIRSVTPVPIFDMTGTTTGRLLLSDDAAAIRTAPFDPAHPALTSGDTSVLENVYFDLENEPRPWLASSNTGTAVYATGNPSKTSLVWVDRNGAIEAVGKDQDVYREAALSPDGTKAIVRHAFDFWIHDLQRGTKSPLTSGPSNIRALWSRDGLRILFGSNRGGDWDIYSQPADGSLPAEALLKRPYDQWPLSASADGTLLYREVHPQTGIDLWSMSRDGKATPVRVTPFNEADGQFSPEAAGAPLRVAYTSDESGRNEIYVQSYPGGANRIAVSTGGGSLPRWSPDGKELFYVTGDALVAVAVRPDSTFGPPRALFDRSNYFLKYSYDVSPDGKRFLMLRRDPGSAPRQLNVILNWSGTLDH
jgi:Tol biopolymer transport system component